VTVVVCVFFVEQAIQINAINYSPEAMLRFGRIMEILYGAKERC